MDNTIRSEKMRSQSVLCGGLRGKQNIIISWEELLYYLFFGILFAAKGMGLDEGQKLFTVCMLISLLCLAGKLCVTSHSLKEWLVMIALVGLSFLIWKNTRMKAAVFAVLVIIGMKNVPIQRLFKVCLGIWGTTFGVSSVLGILHIRDGVVVVHQKLGLGPIIRWSWGYTHPNVLHVSYFILVVLILYVLELHGKKLCKVSAALFAGNLFVFLYSVSYTGVLLVSGYLILNIYLDARKQLVLVEKVLLQCIMPFCVIFPLAGPFITSGKVFDFFDKLLSTRFQLVRNFFTNFTPSLFGTPADFNIPAHLTLDSSFAYLLMYYGIVAFVLFLMGYFAIIYEFIRRQQKKELAIMIGISVAGITEQFLFNLSFKNLSFFFLGNLLFELLAADDESAPFWNTEKALLPVKEHSVAVPCFLKKEEDFSEIGAKKKLFFYPAVAGVAAGFICSQLIKMPESVYVDRWATDYRNIEEEVLVNLEEMSDDFNSLVIGYSGPESGMYIFKGNIIQLEYVRDVMGIGMLAAVFILTVMLSEIQIVEMRRKNEKRVSG